MSAGPGPGEPPRRRDRSRQAADHARGAAGRVGSSWRALSQHQKLAAVAAIALLVSMLLPWYQETGFAVVRGRPVSLDDSKNAFQVYSFVEAAIFVVTAGVLVLLYARGQRKAFHLPGGDGTVILAAGLWVMFLIFYRQLDKPDGRREGPISTSVGVEWGIFIAFLLGALLAYAGYRIRAAHTPEPVADDVPPPPPPPAREPDPEPDPGPPPTGATQAAPTTPAPPPATTEDDAGDEEPTVARPRSPKPEDGQLSFDEPTEYRPPRRR